MAKKLTMGKKKPTKLQKRTVTILKENPDMSLGEAMREAGYSEKTSRTPGKNFLELKGTQVALEHWRVVLRESGLGEKKLLEKYKEWVDAQKVVSARITGKDADSRTDDFIEVPDYNTQLKAGEMIREDLGVKINSSTNVAVQVNVQPILGEMKAE